jgi:hypothetical protein
MISLFTVPTREEFQTERRPHSGPLENAECLSSWIDRSHHLLILTSSGISSARLQLSCSPWAHLVRRSPHRTSEEVADLSCNTLLAGSRIV